MPDDDVDDDDEVQGETQLVNDATSCLNIFSSKYEKISGNKNSPKLRSAIANAA